MNLTQDQWDEMEPIILDLLIEILNDSQRSYYISTDELSQRLMDELGFNEAKARRNGGRFMSGTEYGEFWSKTAKAARYKINEEAVREAVQ